MDKSHKDKSFESDIFGGKKEFGVRKFGPKFRPIKFLVEGILDPQLLGPINLGIQKIGPKIGSVTAEKLLI